jgi:hypothetical protein
VAILGSVYGEMGDKGAFYYKYYKYKYAILQYAISDMQDAICNRQ